MLFSVCSSNYSPNRSFSLLNMGTGYSPYCYYDEANQYLGFERPSKLQNFKAKATWIPHYQDDRSVVFQNAGSNYCMEFSSSNERVKQNKCDFNSDSMRLILDTTITRALLIKFQKNGDCLYANTDTDNGHIYAGPCKDDDIDYHWTKIPPLA